VLILCKMFITIYNYVTMLLTGSVAYPKKLKKIEQGTSILLYI